MSSGVQETEDVIVLSPESVDEERDLLLLR